MLIPLNLAGILLVRPPRAMVRCGVAGRSRAMVRCGVAGRYN